MPNFDGSDHSGYLQIELYLNGNYKTLIPSVDTEWQLGGGHIKAAGGQLMQFYEDGTFKSLTLAENTPVVVHGVEAILVAGSEIQFYSSGAIRKITLAKQTESYFWSAHWSYQGLSVAPFTTIEFRTDGSVRGLIKTGLYDNK
jgi:uncharacterized protein (UPF0276 family)